MGRLRKLAGRPVTPTTDPAEIEPGEEVRLPAEEWLSLYKIWAPKMQVGLDVIRNWIVDNYEKKVLGQKLVCNPSGTAAAAEAGEEPTMDDAAVAKAIKVLR